MNTQEFKTIYDLIIGTISSTCTALLIGYLNRKIQDKKLSMIFTVIIISIFIIIANYSMKSLIENSSSVRQWIDPNNFVEGYWYETSPPDSNNKIKHETLIKIEYKNGNLVLTGETYDTTGKSYANFRSTTTAYNEGELFLQYTSFNITHGIGQGFDQLQFNTPPNSYKGFVFSSTSKKYYSMAGTKINDKELQSYNNFNKDSDKKKFILDLLKSINSKQY